MKRIAIVIVALFPSLCIGSGGQNTPPAIPYIDEGACPFECCVYREWQATEDVVTYQVAKDASEEAFSVKTGERVVAETGFVITTKIEIVKVLKSINAGYDPKSKEPGSMTVLKLMPDDTLYTLHDMGEGNTLFWFRGRIYYDELTIGEPYGREPPEQTAKELQPPEYDWWVKIKSSDGREAWLKNPPIFRHADACSADT